VSKSVYARKLAKIETKRSKTDALAKVVQRAFSGEVFSWSLYECRNCGHMVPYPIHNKKVKSGTSYSPRIEENEGEISVSQREIVTTWSDELL
jgi:hypothetical protein